MSIITKTFALAFLTLAHCMRVASAQACIGSFDALRELEVARGNNNSVPVTYVICPNTVFNMSATFDQWEMNGNTNYMCGEDGSSKNNCTVTGGEAQVLIYFFGLDQATKENILVSGFTFEKSSSANIAIGYWGKHTFRDCIFRVSMTLRCNSTLGFVNIPRFSVLTSSTFLFFPCSACNLGPTNLFRNYHGNVYSSNTTPSHSHVSWRRQV